MASFVKSSSVKFGDISFSLFGFIVRTDRQTDRQTEAHDRYTHATPIGVSSSSNNN